MLPSYTTDRITAEHHFLFTCSPRGMSCFDLQMTIDNMSLDSSLRLFRLQSRIHAITAPLPEQL